MINVNLSTNEMFLYGVVGGSWMEDGFTALEVIDQLKAFGKKEVTVRINSPGGSADDGIAIYNALMRHEPGVHTVVDSLAASAASVIALAGKTRTSSTGSRWMIHQALTLAVGNSVDMRKMADTLDVYDASIVEIYSQYMPEGTDILSLMEAETWYTAEESMAIGLSTALGSKTKEKPAIASWFKNTPANLMEPMNHGKLYVARARALMGTIR